VIEKSFKVEALWFRSQKHNKQYQFTLAANSEFFQALQIHSVAHY